MLRVSSSVRSEGPSWGRSIVDYLPVYDVASRHTFDELVKWFREIETYCGEDVAKMIVGNKVDKVGRD